MTKFEVWRAGDAESYVLLLGEAEADTFLEACAKVCWRTSEWYPHYDPTTNTVWGNALYPTRHEAAGFKKSTSYTADNQLVVKVGDQEVLRLPFRPSGNGIEFPEAGWLAGKIKDTVDDLNMKRYGEW